jgi:hypothetical protein
LRFGAIDRVIVSSAIHRTEREHGATSPGHD